MNEGKKLFNSKTEMLLTAALLLAALCVFLLWRQRGAGEESFLLVIQSDGKEVLREELRGPREYRIESPDGGYNIIAVEECPDGGGYGICCREADCPEHTCMEQGFVAVPDEPIVCLPHRMTAVLLPGNP